MHTHTKKDKQKTFECVLSKCTNSEFEMYLKVKQFYTSICYIRK